MDDELRKFILYCKEQNSRDEMAKKIARKNKAKKFFRLEIHAYWLNHEDYEQTNSNFKGCSKSWNFYK